MESLLVPLAFLACPIAMGLMVWFMGKGMHKEDRQPPVRASVEHLREEHRRLGEEIERLEDAGDTRTTVRRT